MKNLVTNHLFLCSVVFFLAGKTVFGQTETQLERPKLVVGLVVDQMRYDYLYRYYDQYGEDGFKRLLREGFNCRSHHYHYGNTSTGAGHASVYSGSAPAIHGIIGNSWYDTVLGRSVNCVEDEREKGVGGRTPSVGKASPRNLLVTTVTDQLRLATNFQSKTISISLKDRGAILPGGHTANAAYWYDGYTGNWVTSTYYMNELPQWVREFNARKLPAQLLREGWSTLLPLSEYTQSTSDDQTYEDKLSGNDRPVFPYDLVGQSGDAFGLAGSTPQGNTLIREMGMAAMQGENLGKGKFTDFLCLSFSATDGVGHRYGPNSVEIQDVYLRLDRELAALLKFLDNWVGKGEYIIFLTADHGIIEVPEFAQKNRLPYSRFSSDSVYAHIRKAIARDFGDEKIVKAIEIRQIYLDKSRMKAKGIKVDDVVDAVRDELLLFDGVAEVVNARKLGETTLTAYQRNLFSNEIHPKRSGDILIIFQPGWITRATYGTTHGSPYGYDTHIPFLISGWGVKKGETYRRTHICDIAPTLSALLQILPPSGNIGNVVEEALLNH